MPRTARKKSGSGVYHIMQRGINKQTIFEDDEDYQTYIQFLLNVKEKSDFKLYAYCLMGNHTHLLIKEEKEPLELIFKKFGVKYVYWYNWKYQRTGHLFQDRFKSECIEDDNYLLSAIRYILHNPCAAGLCKTLDEYPWSSYALIEQANNIIDTLDIYNILPKPDLLRFLNAQGTAKFMDVDIAKRLTDHEAGCIIKKLCHLQSCKDFVHLPQYSQTIFIKKLNQENISIRQLSRLTGLSNNCVEKYLK